MSKARVVKVGVEVNGTLQGFEFNGEGIPDVVGIDYSQSSLLVCGYTLDELRAMIDLES